MKTAAKPKGDESGVRVVTCNSPNSRKWNHPGLNLLWRTMNSYIGSLRYDHTGRKRKSPGLKTKRKLKPEFKPLVVEKSYADLRMEEFNKKYPSYTGSTKYQPEQDQSWKQEESKNFTVAPAYNKGAYQVIPRKDVKHIGK